jgi:hypothetical protein
MSGNANNGPMLKAAGLWAKTSGKGGQYFTGWLGGVKVLVLENRDRKGDDDPSHHLFFVEAAPRPDRREGAQERGGGQQRASPCPRSVRGHPRLNAAASRGMPVVGPTGRRRCATTGRCDRRLAVAGMASRMGRRGNAEFFDTGKKAAGRGISRLEKALRGAVSGVLESDNQDGRKGQPACIANNAAEGSRRALN